MPPFPDQIKKVNCRFMRYYDKSEKDCMELLSPSGYMVRVERIKCMPKAGSYWKFSKLFAEVDQLGHYPTSYIWEDIQLTEQQMSEFLWLADNKKYFVGKD